MQNILSCRWTTENKFWKRAGVKLEVCWLLMLSGKEWRFELSYKSFYSIPILLLYYLVERLLSVYDVAFRHSAFRSPFYLGHRKLIWDSQTDPEGCFFFHPNTEELAFFFFKCLIYLDPRTREKYKRNKMGNKPINPWLIWILTYIIFIYWLN